MFQKKKNEMRNYTRNLYCDNVYNNIQCSACVLIVRRRDYRDDILWTDVEYHKVLRMEHDRISSIRCPT